MEYVRYCASLTLTVQTGNREAGMGGLQGMYDAYQNGQFEYWEPTTVGDYRRPTAGFQTDVLKATVGS